MTGPLQPRDAALLGAGIPVGWCLLDVAVFLTSGDPGIALEILPGCLGLLLAGGLFGLAWRRLPWLLPVVALLAVLGSVSPRLGFGPRSVAAVWLARGVFCACLAFWAARLAERRFPPASFRLGLAAGLLAGMAMGALEGWTPPHARYFLPCAVAILGSAWVRRPAWRWSLTALAIAIPFVPLAQRTARKVSSLRPDLPALAAAKPGRGPNLLLIVLDTVRADHLGSYGHERDTTPALDVFARDHATLFEEVRATTSWTLPSHASMFTGLLPAQHGADHPRGRSDANTLSIAMRPAQRLRPDVPTLAERLQAEGYRTAAIVANGAYLDHRFGLDRGFEHYDDRPGAYVGNYVALPQVFGYRLRTGHVVYRDAGTISGLALRWLESARGERPLFLMLNYMDAHVPVFPPPPYQRHFGPEQPADPRHPEKRLWPLVYDRALRYIDSEIERVLEWLVAQELFDETVVIVTSDHGEAFGEHGYWSHAWELHEELLRVPLLVKPAGKRLKPRESQAMSVADIHDLALGLVGLREPAPYAARALAAEWYHGSAGPEIRRWADSVGRDVEVDLVTWVDEGRKYLVASDGSVKAFDLPDESKPVDLPKVALERARAKALEWWRAHPPRGEDAAPLKEHELEQLRALGYVQ